MKQLLIANWKMYLSFAQSITLAKQCAAGLKNHADAVSIVLCPSFESIGAVVQTMHNSGIAVGAQNCAPALHGAYTGQVSAANVAELGCTYCIIGHAEQQALYTDFEPILRQQLACVLDAGLIAVVCIGESKQQQNMPFTAIQDVLREQLQSIKQLLRARSAPSDQLCIAYEPAWAIGAGQMPDAQQLTERLGVVRELINQELSIGKKIKLLYGGAVNAENSTLPAIASIDGFLVGRATTDFQSFQKIVLSMIEVQ